MTMMTTSNRKPQISNRKSFAAASVLAALIVAGAVLPAAAQTPNLAFCDAGQGAFAFDTGVLKGTLRADASTAAVTSIVDAKTGAELLHGPGGLGLFTFYRLLAANHRWGDVIWTWPKNTRLSANGAVEIAWPPADDHPLEIIATLKWSSPESLDMTVRLTPQRDVAAPELFLGSYFAAGFDSLVYLAAPRHAPGKPDFLRADVGPLTHGTYMMFPRDLKAARLIYDGRWEIGSNPVQWSISRYIAAPLAMRRDEKKDVAAVLMARKQDCFAVGCSYNMQPPDGVAAHYSTYLCLFGEDLKAGQSATAKVRAVFGRGLTPARAVELYDRFEREAK